MTHGERLLIVDFGSRYTQLIARGVRAMNVYCEILPCTTAFENIRAFNAKGIILTGGPASAELEKELSVDPALFELGVPVLGIGYGCELMVTALGGRGTKAATRVDELANVVVSAGLGGFAAGDAFKAWMTTSARINEVPEGFDVWAKTEAGAIAGLADDKRALIGVSFHPEAVQTERGEELISDFLDRCGFARDWNMKSLVETATKEIREKTAGESVICGLSGGVDSAVAAMLIHHAIGDRLRCLFVDHGLLRKGEREEVERAFKERFHVPLTTIDASERFLSALAGVGDPEQKRKIIGRVFIEEFEGAIKKDAAEHGSPTYLAQGTLYPDVVESVSFKSGGVAVKSHHNVGGLPEQMNLKLLEPLRELYKDEVRQLGRELGLPDEIVDRHPFPGPGLGIRVLGEITKEKLETLREADFILREEIRAAGLQKEIWQVFVVLLPVKTVGVMGDKRTYENACAIRAVSSVDGMTADWSRIPFDVLAKISNRIIHEVPGINRVTYDITSKPPGTIEWE